MLTLTMPCGCTEGLTEDNGYLFACTVDDTWQQAWCECHNDGHLCGHLADLLHAIAGLPWAGPGSRSG
jgi:hypothetical protein